MSGLTSHFLNIVIRDPVQAQDRCIIHTARNRDYHRHSHEVINNQLVPKPHPLLITSVIYTALGPTSHIRL